MMPTRKKKKATKKVFTWDLPNGPVVKNPPSNVGETSSILVGELGSHMPPSN